MRLRRQQQQQQQQLATARDKRQPDILNQPVRRCGDDGRWKGKLGFCQGEQSHFLSLLRRCQQQQTDMFLSLKTKALTCPPLTKPANGSVSPASCATGDAAPHQHCYFTCNPGFRVTGNPVRTCLPSLKWNPLRPPPTCEKGKIHRSSSHPLCLFFLCGFRGGAFGVSFFLSSRRNSRPSRTGRTDKQQQHDPSDGDPERWRHPEGDSQTNSS